MDTKGEKKMSNEHVNFLSRMAKPPIFLALPPFQASREQQTPSL
jgi:hypothetical protein